jgi:NAD(P)-dependent dehydrogenase (short-subunit alcohol dehydrogenase family)
MGSVSGRVAVPISGPYAASKWALEGMIESLRLELIPFGVRVVLIEPGPYHTALHDNQRLSAGAGHTDSPYAELLAAYHRQLARLPRQDDLEPLIDVIERAATGDNPGLRWPVGPTSLTGGRLRAFVPDRLYEWLMRLAFPIRSRP